MYDIVGDIHGCYDELILLMSKLGYVIKEGMDPCTSPFYHPKGRKVVSVGDMVDRGPNSPRVLALLRQMVLAETGIVVLGNHDDKLMRWLKGNKVKIANGLQLTICQLYNKSSPIDKPALYQFLSKLPERVILDEGKLLVCHAGLAEEYHLRKLNRRIRSKCLYGETTGETDANGLPIRLPWQNNYSGKRVIVHGHVSLDEVSIVNNVYNVDTSCVFGGKLTALRYPEMKIVSQPALAQYAKKTIRS